MVFDAVFLGAACQFPTLHRIETECSKDALFHRLGPLSEGDIGYALERNDTNALFTLGCRVACQLKRNRKFRSQWSRGLVVAAVDGIEICSSFARSCEYCMERRVAVEDLLKIQDFISLDSPAAAKRVIDQLFVAFDHLARRDLFLN